MRRSTTIASVKPSSRTSNSAPKRRSLWSTDYATPIAQRVVVPSRPPAVARRAVRLHHRHLHGLHSPTAGARQQLSRRQPRAQKAADAAKPSPTVHVAPGTYNGNVSTKPSGTETARIVFIARHRCLRKLLSNPSQGCANLHGPTPTVSSLRTRAEPCSPEFFSFLAWPALPAWVLGSI